MFEYDGKIERFKYLCNECGEKHVKSVGFLLKDGSAFSAYRAYLHDKNDGDPTIKASFEVIFADWQNSKDYEVFSAIVREKDEGFVFTPIDTCENDTHHDWHYLTREEALKHDQVTHMWEVIDFLGEHDPNVSKAIYG